MQMPAKFYKYFMEVSDDHFSIRDVELIACYKIEVNALIVPYPFQ